MGAAGDEPRGQEVLPYAGPLCQPLLVPHSSVKWVCSSCPEAAVTQSHRGLDEGWLFCRAGTEKVSKKQVFRNAGTTLPKTSLVSDGRIAVTVQGLLQPSWKTGTLCCGPSAQPAWVDSTKARRSESCGQDGGERGTEEAVKDRKWETGRGQEHESRSQNRLSTH